MYYCEDVMKERKKERKKESKQGLFWSDFQVASIFIATHE